MKSMKECPHITRSFAAFDTTVAVDLWGDGADCVRAAIEIERLCRRFESLFSRTLSTSDVGRVNSASGSWVQVDPCTVSLVRSALGYCERSQGAFDITIGPAAQAWDFKRGVVPDANVLAAAVDLIDWTAVEVDEQGSRVRLARPGMMMDLGGIAKGWMADRIVEAVAPPRYGVSGLIVDLGGNIAVSGAKPDGSAWVVGVKDPFDRARPAASISLEAGSVVTSGTYERSFEREGLLYHHVLDPKTGWPVRTDLASASLVCSRSIDAEGFSTTVLALGGRRGADFAKRQPEIEHACLIGADRELMVF